MRFAGPVSIVALVVGLAVGLGPLERSAGAATPKHPVLKHDLDPAGRPKWETAAAVLLDKSDAELAALVPRQTPFITCGCPSCGAPTYTRGPDRLLWRFTFPDRIACRNCQTEFPDERFPGRPISFLNTRGETIDVPCYVDADGKRFYLDSTIDSWRNEAVVAGIEGLAKLYAVTKNEDYARRVVVLLAAYAEHFPHYLVKDFLTVTDNPAPPRGAQRSRYEFVSTGGPWLVAGKPRGARPSEPAASEQATSTPYGWTQSRWGWGRWVSEIPMPLVRAYDLVYHSPAFEQLSAERKRDVRKQIEDDLFRNAADYVALFPFYYHIHNNAGSQVAEAVRTGMVVGEPRYIALGRRWAESVLEQYAFARDGGFGESPGYFYVFLATNADNFQAVKEAAALGGTGPEAEAVIAGANKAIAFLDKAVASIESTRFPNGSALPLSDNRHDDFADPTVRVGGGRVAPLITSTNVLLPGYGHAVLGAGTGDRQVQAHLHFSPFKEAIHTHADGLSLMLWAFGSELYTDIGYNRSKYRPWASTTLSHNTVVVDRAPQGGTPTTAQGGTPTTAQNGTSTKGRLLGWAEDGRGRSFVQVEDAGAYGPPVTRYRRTLLLDTTDTDGPYVVDVFEVRGGAMHDYALHGPTVFESTAATELPLVPLGGERPLLTADEAVAYDEAKHHYGQFTGVRACAAHGAFAVDVRLTDPYGLPPYTPNPRYPTPASFHYAVDPARYADRAAIGVRTWFVESEEDRAENSVKRQLLLGETPSLLRGGLTGGPLTDKLRRPSLLVRHEGRDGLSSVFVAVHEPYYREPKIKAVRRLKTDESEEAALGLVIERADRTDTILLALDGAAVSVRTPETAKLEGRLAVVRRAAGRPAEGWLVGGTSLAAGDFTLNSDRAAYTGTIDAVASRWVGAAENAFTTSAELPEGTALRGRVLIVHHGDESGGAGAADEGYRIERVQRRGERTVIHLADDPGLRIRDGITEEIFLPRRRWTGPNRFTLPTTAGAPGPVR